MTQDDDDLVSWKEVLDEVAKGDTIIACTLSHDEMHRKFDNGFGDTNGQPFTAWSEEWVYFPVCYDGLEWVARAPRNPCDTATAHVGGG